MFSKEEAAAIRKDFWVSFGKSFPRKWLLYRTKIKGFEFKFDAGRKHLLVALDIATGDEGKDELLYEQMLSLKGILEEALPDIIFDPSYILDNGKHVHRIYCPYPNKFSIYNKNSWMEAFPFMLNTMENFETVFYDFEDHIRSADL